MDRNKQITVTVDEVLEASATVLKQEEFKDILSKNPELILLFALHATYMVKKLFKEE